MGGLRVRAVRSHPMRWKSIVGEVLPDGHCSAIFERHADQGCPGIVESSSVAPGKYAGMNAYCSPRTWRNLSKACFCWHADPARAVPSINDLPPLRR